LLVGAERSTNVPLSDVQSSGAVALCRRRASVDGALTVADEAAPARFEPLRSDDDFHLELANKPNRRGGLAARAEDRHPLTRGTITTILPPARRADLDVPGIAFKNVPTGTADAPPSGVVALVKGEIRDAARSPGVRRDNSSQQLLDGRHGPAATVRPRHQG
jgi:hypothetical protein